MKVILRRDLFLGGIKYEADPEGTEIPDMIDGKKVVLPKEATEGEEKTISLPHDALLFTEENTHKTPVSASHRVKPMTLAEGAALVEGNDGSLHSFSKNDPALAATREAAAEATTAPEPGVAAHLLANKPESQVKNAGTTKNDGKK